MTRDQDIGSGALLESVRADEVQAIPKKAAPAKPRGSFYFPLAAIFVGALAVFGAWAVTQSWLVDELADVPRVYSDHELDWWIHAQLREQARAAQPLATQLDPWIRGRLRERGDAEQTVSGTDPALEHNTQSQPKSGTVPTDRAAQHHERDDRTYLDELGNDVVGAAPLECRPATRPVPC